MKKVKFYSMLLSLAMLFSIFINFQPSEVSAATATSKTPVVFVHGLTGSDTNFALIKRYLRSQGWADNELYAIDLPSKQGHQELNSTAIKLFVDDVISKTGSSKVNIVAHSMGGANSLYYILNKGGSSKVEKLITLGGANRLTTNYAPEGIKTTSIYSSSDFIVRPYLSMLYGANNIEIRGVSHIGLLSNYQVNNLIKSALEE